MEREKTEKKVTLGYDTTCFTDDEVKTAMFFVAYARNPTADELKRIHIRLLTEYGRVGENENWMQLTFTEEAK